MGQCRPYGVETSKSKNKQLIEMLTGCLPLQLITRIRIIHTTDQEQWRTLLHRRRLVFIHQVAAPLCVK